jgi:exodeoxyribonuclease X
VPITAGVIAESVTWLVKPPQPIKYFATAIHGIKTADVASAPAFASIADEVRQALSGKVIVAHNASVDMGVLHHELGDWDCPEAFDTLRLARRLLPGQDNYRLGTLVRALSLDTGLAGTLKPHRAAYDALVTARLFACLATRADGSPRALAELRTARGAEPAREGTAEADEPATLF